MQVEFGKHLKWILVNTHPDLTTLAADYRSKVDEVNRSNERTLDRTVDAYENKIDQQRRAYDNQRIGMERDVQEIKKNVE